MNAAALFGFFIGQNDRFPNLLKYFSKWNPYSFIQKNVPEVQERYPFLTEPPLIDHYREYPPCLSRRVATCAYLRNIHNTNYHERWQAFTCKEQSYQTQFRTRYPEFVTKWKHSHSYQQNSEEGNVWSHRVPHELILGFTAVQSRVKPTCSKI